MSRSQLIPIGYAAPDFTCLLSDGNMFTLSGQRGHHRIALVFYPGNNTPVCTAQLCAFRDDWNTFQHEDTLVFGVNPANQTKHAQFVSRNHFPFPLLVDEGRKIAADYGCRAMFGLIRRSVYLIDKQGRVAFAERGNPTPQSLLKAIQSLTDQSA